MCKLDRLALRIGLLLLASAPGCALPCLTSMECGEGAFCRAGTCSTECLTDNDCSHPPECQDNPTSCTPRGLRCNAVGRCVGRALPRDPEPEGPPGPEAGLEVGEIDGWDDPPGTGRVFVLDALQIAPQDRGFDVDGRCRGPGDCIDNSLWQLGRLGNDQIRQGLLGGETLLLLEIAGLDEPFRGDDRLVTVKLYGAGDADHPFLPANNFQPLPGESTCCRFLINPQSLDTAGQARSRSPARIRRGQLAAIIAMDLSFTLTVGVPPHPEIVVRRAIISGQLSAGLTRFQGGLLGGAVPVGTLARIENPYCKTLNNLCSRQLPDSTLIDLIAGLLQPDIDLDHDGLESVVGGASGRIEACYDGCIGWSCTGPRVPPQDPAQPQSCALDTRLADGYSVALSFSGRSATVEGIGW
ncbi:MAG: hypothetical protein IT384_21850 [Deltaproteobacteria bacterium]|nr:hypothetical protein [Deltaproteobacteria bacterium]